MSASCHDSQRSWLEGQWYRLTPWHLLLLFPALLFWLASSLRKMLYRSGVLSSITLPVPVVIVGNITVGGTGKTPLVLWLAHFLKRNGYHPIIISRGYGGQNNQPQAVRPDDDSRRAGDEPLLLAGRSGCPVWIGRDRVAAAWEALAANPECNVIISDDGLQHYRLGRDVEIAVIDGMRRFGNGLPLPAGPLREMPGRLAEVDGVAVNGGEAGPHEFGMALKGEVFHNVQDESQTRTSSDWTGRPVHGVAGIGNPKRFFDKLRGLGLNVIEHSFPDHHNFAPDDIHFGNEEVVLMTEKDAVKCRKFAPANCWFLPVEAELDPVFGNMILEKLHHRC